MWTLFAVACRGSSSLRGNCVSGDVTIAPCARCKGKESDVSAYYGCRAGPICGTRTGLAMPKKTVTP